MSPGKIDPAAHVRSRQWSEKAVQHVEAAQAVQKAGSPAGRLARRAVRQAVQNDIAPEPLAPPLARGPRESRPAARSAKITKTAVDRLAPAERRQILWDAELRGFGLLVLPSGVKTFVLNYRRGARERRLTLGRYGALTVDEARKKAKQALAAVASDRDPVAELQEKRRGSTMNDLFDRYVEEHVGAHNAPSTQEDIARLMRTHLRPAFGAMPVKAVERADVARFHGALRKTPRRANYALAILSKAFACAEIWGLRPDHSNPARGVRRYPQKHRTRYLNDLEVKRLGRALEEAETVGLPWKVDASGPKAKHLARPENQRSPVPWQAIACVRLLLLTGARRSEILALEWRHVDPAALTLALPSTKGRDRTPHPVSAATMAVLEGLPRPTKSPWVLPRSDDASRHLAKEVLANAWNRIRWAAELEDVHLHDLRHTVGTFAAQSGVNAFIIRDLLRHNNVATTAIYANRAADPIRAVAELVAARIKG